MSGGTAGADGVRRRTVNEHYLRLFRTPYLKVIILSDTDPYRTHGVRYGGYRSARRGGWRGSSHGGCSPRCNERERVSTITTPLTRSARLIFTSARLAASLGLFTV